jgi:hypothetical protein
MRETFYLEFDTRQGTDRLLFVTFRLHLSWAKRLKRGRIVYLLDAKTRTIYGRAKVIGLMGGKTMDVLNEWAHWSHLENPTTCDGAVARRFASLQKRYGPSRVNEHTNLTAIALRRTA